jgi:regulatory protein
MDEQTLTYALKLLSRRDYSRQELGRRLEGRFTEPAGGVLDWLEGRGYLDDRRFARSFVSSHVRWARMRVDAALEERGIAPEIRTEALAGRSWPSARETLRDRMVAMRLKAPLNQKDAARLARFLARMGYEPLEIGDELERYL